MKKNDARPTQADLIKQIKRIMQKKGLNSSKLAKIVGTSRARISQILSGTANLTLFTVGCIAESLDCNLIVRLKRRKKSMLNVSPDQMAEEIRSLFRQNREWAMTALDYQLKEREILFQKYTVHNRRAGLILKAQLEVGATFNSFIKALSGIVVELDPAWNAFYWYVMNQERDILLALMHNPGKTEEEAIRMNELKAYYYPGMSDTEIINSYKQQKRDKDNAAAGAVTKKHLYDEADAHLAEQLFKEMCGEPKSGPGDQGIVALLANEDIIRLQSEKPGETGKIIFPSPAISCVKYRGVGDVVFCAYGAVRAVTNENGTFYMVASIFTESGNPLNEIAIPKESVIFPITETYYRETVKPDRRS